MQLTALSLSAMCLMVPYLQSPMIQAAMWTMLWKAIRPLSARSGHPPCLEKDSRSPSDPNSYFRLGSDVCRGSFLM